MIDISTISDEQKSDSSDVAAIITAMTDSESSFLYNTVEAVLSDPGIGQVILCIEQNNSWINTLLNSLLTDKRLEILRMPLAPPGRIRNEAVRYVKKPWVAYCDGDDIWCRGKTLIQRAYANTKECDFVGIDHYLTDENGKVCAIALAKYIPMPSSWMIRTKVMREYPFNESMRTAEDGEWWWRTNYIIRKARCPKLLLKYRVRSKSMSSDTPSKRNKAKLVALASIPLFGKSILFLSYCIWLLNRQEKYLRPKSR